MRSPEQRLREIGAIEVYPLAHDADGNSDRAGDCNRQSKFYPASDLKGRPKPPRPWLVTDWIPRRQVTLFYGDGGTGKSLAALQLAVSVTARHDWLGMPVDHGRAIVVSAEDDDDELHRRLDDIVRAYGKSYDELAGLTLRSLAGEDALLAVETGLKLVRTELFGELDRRAETDGPALIVIDTLADVYPANENDRAKVRQFVGMLRGLAIRHDCAVLLLGHPSLSGMASGSGMSGSTAWNNSVRSRLYLTRIEQDGYERDPDKRLLSTKKINYARAGNEIFLTWREGVFFADEQPSGMSAMAAGAKAERVFLRLLDEYTQQGRYVSANPGPTYAPSQFADHPEAEGVTKRAFKSTMNGLLHREEIRIVEHISNRAKRSHIERSRKTACG